MKPQHLRNAPIVEAMIAYDFETQDKDQSALLNRFYEAVRVDYPVRVAITQNQFIFSPEGSNGQTEIIGARFSSADGKRACAINKVSFIGSRLAPYERWEDLRDEFERLWNIFSSLAEIKIVKIAVRYINKVYVPAGKEMSLTLKTRPEIAEELPQQMSNVFVRLELAIPDPSGVLIITEAQLAPEMEGFITFVLDHDLQFPITADTPDIRELLETARSLKNQYFFASISDELAQEYL